MKRLSFLIIFFYSFFNSTIINGQSIRGSFYDESSSEGIANIEFEIDGQTYNSDADGNFDVPNNFPEGKLTLNISDDDYEPFSIDFVNQAPNKTIQLGLIFLSNRKNASKYQIDQSNYLDQEELDLLEFDEGVSSLLSASRDPFGNTANFNFSVTRFNPRGLAQDYSHIYLNNVQFNNLRDGRYFYSLWGGLNDMFRSTYSEVGLNPTDYGVGSLSGMVDYDLRATGQREGTSLTLNYTNRSYKQRALLSHNSGVQENGWAYSICLSRRWGDRGYVEGTYYDAYAYFISIDKKINEKHSLNVIGFASPGTRGRSSNSTQFVYDLVGDNFYNPNWGFQNGKVRNSREYRTHQPVFMLRHDFKLSNATSITTAAAFQTGKFGSTRLGWIEAPDPRPDYYGNLPYDNTLNLSESDLALLEDGFRNNVNIRQLNWDLLYRINRDRRYPVVDSDGTGSIENISAYVIEEQRFDNNKLNLNSNINHWFNNRIKLTAGLGILYDRNHNFKVLADLLGGENFIDIDGFVLRESRDPVFIQNDIERPNRLLQEGDRFGYDYYIHNMKSNLWSTLNFQYDKIDFTVSALAESTSFYREGLIANGKFPNNSKGNSEKQNFLTGTLKLGATYKFNGRNYIYTNLSYMTRAPYSRYSFESPDTRNNIVRGLTEEKVMGGELTYIMRHPKANIRFTGFYFEARDGIESSALYFDAIDQLQTGAFVNLITTNIDKVNYGMELGIDYKLSKTINIGFASAIGEYYYSNRPDLTLTIDNSGQSVNYDQNLISYIKGSNIESMPQIAHSLDLEYRSPKDWSISVNANFFDDIFIDQNPLRRTIAVSNAVLDFTGSKDYSGLGSEDLISQISAQQKYDSFFTVDLFARKRWRWDDYRLEINLSVDNLLNNREIIYSGFEQLRFDFQGLDANRFAPRYNYAYGLNYSLGIKFSI